MKKKLEENVVKRLWRQVYYCAVNDKTVAVVACKHLLTTSIKAAKVLMQSSKYIQGLLDFRQIEKCKKIVKSQAEYLLE